MNQHNRGQGAGGGQRPHSGGGGSQPPRGGRNEPSASIDLSRVRFATAEGQPLDADLFAGVAERCARTVGLREDERPRKENKPSQLRKFYDELVMWDERVRAEPQKFAEFLPFIRMLNAKAAYAKGRELVDVNYEALMNHCLKEVTSAENLHRCKTFFEAFMGYYKVVRPRD
ncbi:MAG TPA: type III-A CRISPR-associated protein Csm2 [Candidatus Macondimonas sp.]|nr:type III-A CRISPR-associated protein Csm2 [Candidatus Macondimonas sp.]